MSAPTNHSPERDALDGSAIFDMPFHSGEPADGGAVPFDIREQVRPPVYRKYVPNRTALGGNGPHTSKGDGFFITLPWVSILGVEE